MKKRYSKQRNKRKQYSSETSDCSHTHDNSKSKKASAEKCDKTEDSTVSKDIQPIITKGLKWVAYRELFPKKLKTGTQILAALKKYDFSKVKEDEHKTVDRDGEFDSEDEFPEMPEMGDVSSKKHLFKKFKGGIKPKSCYRATKTKGFKIHRDPLFKLRHGPKPPNDIWYPPIPGMEVPLEDASEVVGNLMKPAPKDPEEEAKYDKMQLPTPNEIYEQFMSKKGIVKMREPEEFKPGELEELWRTRTTMADLKHFYETGELIERD